MDNSTNEPSAASTVTTTVENTIESLLPALAATGAVASPQAAAVTALAPLALNFLQAAMQLQSAGGLTAEGLATLFASVGQGVASSHAQWTALNAASAVKTA